MILDLVRQNKSSQRQWAFAKTPGIHAAIFHLLLKIKIINKIAKASKTETLDLCQRKPCLAMRQGGILFLILEFIAHFIMMKHGFSNVLFGNCE